MAARTLVRGSRFPNVGQWPRRWDARINLTVNTGATTDIPTDPGRVFGFDCPGVIIPLGQWTGIEMSTLEAAVDFAPLQAGLPLPRKVRLRSTGASATAPQLTLAFWGLTDEEQRDLGGAMVSALASAAATLSGPFPPATSLAANEGLDAVNPPIVSRVGALQLLADPVNNLWSPMRGIDATVDGRAIPTAAVLWAQTPIFNPSTGLFDRMRSIAGNVDGVTPPTLGMLLANALGLVVNDRTATLDRLRQPNATAPKSVVQSAVSIASTGVKATRTMAQDGYIRFAVISTLTGVPTNAVVQLQVVRSAVTYAIGNTGQLPATLNVSFPIGFVTSNVAPWMGVPVVAGDVVQINVITAAGAAAACDFALGIEENRFVQ